MVMLYWHVDMHEDVAINGGTIPFFPKFDFFCPCHNFFPLSSVQIIIIPACCLLCVF